MRYFTVILFLLAFSWSLIAQQKLIVTDLGDVIPIKKGESAMDAAKRVGLVAPIVQSNDCNAFATFGFTPDQYKCTLDFVGYHHDTWGQWFEAPANGKIDSFFFRSADQNELGAVDNNAPDSIIKIQIWHSRISSTTGPGHEGYPAARTGWGYYPTTTTFDDDPDETPISPIPTEAIGGIGGWISTVEGGTPSYPPFDTLLWGGASGANVKVHHDPVNGGTTEGGVINGFALKTYDLLHPVNVTKNYPLFVTMRQTGNHFPAGAGGTNHAPATWCMSAASGNTRNWKFYEHAAGPGRGWQARGEATWNWWFVMTATSDVPPKVVSIDLLGHTLNPVSRHVQTQIQDCNPENPAFAGVVSATMTYKIGNNAPVTIPLSHPGGDLYEADIPAAPAGTHVSYYVTATDSNANTASSLNVEYSVVSIGNTYYGTDTAATYDWIEIRNSGHRVGRDVSDNPDTSWFNPRNASLRRDDGSWGPADMGAWFTYFGDSVRYAWLGTNGGLALSKTPLDTQQIVGSGGSVPSSWIFPSTILGVNNDAPQNLVSPFLNDLALGPETTGYKSAHGNVYFSYEGNKFIAEWDSVGQLNRNGDTSITFQVIFDHSDQSVKFQYKDIGIGGAEFSQTMLIGIQGDPSSDDQYVMLNKVGTPLELRARNGHAYRFYPSPVPMSVNAGWNMVSVPFNADNYSKSYLFPSSVSNAFGYQGGYVIKDPMSVGAGYWLKFAGVQTLYVPQTGRINLDTMTLDAKWNMIGSISGTVPLASIAYDPDESTVKGSNYFGFGPSGYSTATSIEPGKGYWFKSKIAGGKIILQTTNNTPKSKPQSDPLANLSTIKIRDARGSEQTLYFGSSAKLTVSPELYEMPPTPPQGMMDVRFASQRMVEVHPAAPSAKTEFPIQIQSAVYPVTVSWDIKNADGVAYEIANIGGSKDANTKTMKSSGNVKIADPVQSLVIRAKATNSVTPSSYALEQNYPNPFNPTTELKYALPHDSHVRLTVFNVIGQEIATLVDEIQDAGFHEVTWNAHNVLNGQVGSGVYFYRIDATNVSDTKDVFSQVRKMMLVK